MTLRFRGDVPGAILWPHVVCMFAGIFMVVWTMAGCLSLIREPAEAAGPGPHKLVAARLDCGDDRRLIFGLSDFDPVAAQWPAHRAPEQAVESLAARKFDHAVTPMGNQDQTTVTQGRCSPRRQMDCSRNMRAIVPLPNMDNAPQNRLVWLDLEMTGLDSANDSILEIATIVTDDDLNELAVGPVCAIRHPESVLAGMDDWNTEHHQASGLWQRVLQSEVSMWDAQRETLEFLSAWVEPGASPLCGNSICQDRRFLARLMPELECWFHYRNLDVSTLKELARRWAPQLLESFVKESRHEALADIRESIQELRHYRSHMGDLGGCK